jgi:hypothetical protein
MSIIYDALKKVENTNLKDFESPKKEIKKRKTTLFLYAGLVIVGFLAANIIFKIINNQTSKDALDGSFLAGHKPEVILPAPALQTPAALTPSSSRLVLGGILYDETQPYAIINDKVVKVGDSLPGAKLIQIFSDRVELESEDGERINLRFED